MAQTEQPSNSVIFKELFNISTASEEPFSLISPVMELDISNHIAQTIQREYQSKLNIKILYFYKSVINFLCNSM